MGAPCCWICNRKMKLNRDSKGLYWLHCGPCAATFMTVTHMEIDEFLAEYDEVYRERRGDNQLALF